ncbi:hypothetical protein [Flammeovirga kamogawensis]|uniref:Uncharacterized protein n=1 Tax=Flammeovirga kamogawensis TaxID=373891 RepID=A0ABX8H4C3_9BACT|nr:hypothetical protein [Flammeovirga kamogawensis]MBB6460452.1 hypothetical protein [Flammeovirga kamogawensis]QWG10257.1 hypothetical protein KM029_21480 [Flammeovirga kamogawensis]TRX64706.1 hypothetical protein EO216_19405 [Flammeovirga kamogawensis]
MYFLVVEKKNWYKYIDPLELDEFGYLQGMILKHDSSNGFKIANTSTSMLFEKFSNFDTRYDNIGQILYLTEDSLLIKMKTPLKIMKHKGKYLPIAVDTLLFLSNPYKVDPFQLI